MGIGLEQIKFNSDGHQLVGDLVYPVTVNHDPPPGVLFLHGGGRYNGRRIYQGWQKFLAENGFSSFAFDFTGVGDSTGEFESGSLASRLQDASQALRIFVLSDKVCRDRVAITGTSMGGHVALRLTESNPFIKAVILHGSAAYSEDSEDKKFNCEFSQAIRVKDSYLNSPVFRILENFPGCVLAVYGEGDSIIPEKIQQRYREIAQKKGVFSFIPTIGHTFLSNADNNKQCEQAAQRLFILAHNFLVQYL